MSDRADGRTASDLNVFRVDLVDSDVSETAIEMVQSASSWLPPELHKARSKADEFNGRLRVFWKRPLEKLEGIIAVSDDLGTDLNDHLRGGRDPAPDDIEALTRIHSRCVQTSREILCLLSNGFADGAMGRWRTLHELALVSLLLAAHGKTLARRYLDHAVIQHWESAQKHVKRADTLGFKPLDKETVETIERRADELLSTYGQNFRSSFGWAAPVFAKERPTLLDVEELCGLSYLRLFTHESSDSVHASSKGVQYRAGLSETLKHYPERHDQTLLAGPSNEGLADPIQLTSVSLIVATGALASLSENGDFQHGIDILRLWHQQLLEDLDSVDLTPRDLEQD
jgi:hypothetical protein